MIFGTGWVLEVFVNTYRMKMKISKHYNEKKIANKKSISSYQKILHQEG